VTEKEPHSTWARWLKILDHPIRRRLLKLFWEARFGPPLSPMELSEMLRLPLPRTSYHVRSLAKAKAIVLVSTEQVRGSQKHFYKVGSTVGEHPWVLDFINSSQDRD
jgi:DNA-binding transcriptional ArsR family regulator